MGLEGHHMSRATSIRFSRAYGSEDGVWMRLYLLHFLSEGATHSESFTWQQAEQRYNQHLREPVLNALSKIAPGSVRAGSSFMRAGQEFKKYEDLNLSNCRCNSLPHGVWSIQTLVRLNLSYCSLRELSPGITQLVNLKVLNLQHNNFSALPEAIGNLKSLIFLSVEGTAIKELPEGIGNCTALQTLSCWSCSSLESLPPTIGNLKSLIVLSVKGTAIKELPEAIGDLKSLIVLNVAGTAIKELPRFGELRSPPDIELRRVFESAVPSTQCRQLHRTPGDQSAALLFAASFTQQLGATTEVAGLQNWALNPTISPVGHTTSHHITSHHITSHHITSHHAGYPIPLRQRPKRKAPNVNTPFLFKSVL